jgi:tetratricopeptide (TPR) repeat protein
LTGVTDDGNGLGTAQMERFFDLPAVQGNEVQIPEDVDQLLNEVQEVHQEQILEALTQRNGDWFDIEMDKLEHWADDRRASLKVELDDLDEAIKETRKAARLAPNLPEKLAKQQTLRKLESKRDEAWRNYDEASKEVDRKKDDLLDEISNRLEQNTVNEKLFVIRWKVN